jgi:hypothetical protein
MKLAQASYVAIVAASAALTGCGSSGSAGSTTGEVDSTGKTTLDVVPGTGTATPRGTGQTSASDIVGTQVLQSIVPLTLADVPVEVTASITGTTVKYEKVCVTMDLCQYYDDNEIGVAVKTVPMGLDIQHFASTFSWTTTTPVLADGKHAGDLVIDVAPHRYDSLTPVPPCPTRFCSTQGATATGTHITLGNTGFVGKIAVEIDLNATTGGVFGGSDVAVPLAGEARMTPITDPATHTDVTNLALPL